MAEQKRAFELPVFKGPQKVPPTDRVLDVVIFLQGPERQRVLQKKLIQKKFPSPHPNQKRCGTQEGILKKQPKKMPSLPFVSPERESTVPT